MQDLVEELAKPHWYVDRKGETPPGKKEFYQLPIYNYHKVNFCSALPPLVLPHLQASLSDHAVLACILLACRDLDVRKNTR